MDYQKHYDLLIARAKNRIIDGYKERHRIVPGWLGGKYNKENCVFLTAREHYLAHALLYKIHRSSQAAHAWFCMCRQSNNQERKFTSIQYENARMAHANMLSKTSIGANNNFFGKRHTNDTKAKISESVRNWYKEVGKSKDSIAVWVEKVARKPKSKEHRKKIGRKGFVMLKNSDTGECVRVLKSDVSNYDPDIWKNPNIGIVQKTAACNVCGKICNMGNLKRWHNENCKNKISW